MPQANAERVAQALNLTVQRVHQLVKEGLPKEARGQFDPVKCMLWYIRYLQAALEKKALPMQDGSYAGEREERVRLLRVQADLQELQLASERGLMVTLSDAEHRWTGEVLTTKARIMAIPSRLAPELVGQDSRATIQAKMEKAFKEALSSLKTVDNGGNAEPPKRSS